MLGLRRGNKTWVISNKRVVDEIYHLLETLPSQGDPFESGSEATISETDTEGNLIRWIYYKGQNVGTANPWASHMRHNAKHLVDHSRRLAGLMERVQTRRLEI